MDMLPNCFRNRLLGRARLVGLTSLFACLGLSLAWMPGLRAGVQIVVGTNTYVPFSPLAKAGTKVFIDASPDGKTPVHAMQRSLGYREVDYKALVFASLSFTPVRYTKVGDDQVFDYSGQTGMTNLIGYWTAKNVPILVGPDGEPYIADGHHTTAGYLSPLSPIRSIIPGQSRILFGHIAANAFEASTGPKPVSDDWWQERVTENNAYLYGTNGNQLIPGTSPGAVGFGPIAPSAQPMPTTPSGIVAPNVVPMGHDLYRSLTWGVVDGITFTAVDVTGKRIVGFGKKAPTGGEINFVEFCWADFLRNRIWWDDTRPGWALDSTNAAANVIGAPLGFFAAVANGIALARSEAYRDQFGRSVRDYLDGDKFSANTVNWAKGSITNTMLTGTNTFHLYWFDDSHIVGPITPSPRSINILHINTTNSVAISDPVENVSTVYINEAGSIKTAWRDARIKNSVMKYPPGKGTVALAEDYKLDANVIVASGAFAMKGQVKGSVQVTGGTLLGYGRIGGTLTVGRDGIVALDSPTDLLKVQQAIRLNGRIGVTTTKVNGVDSSSRMETPEPIFLKGTLVVTTGGTSKLTDGDSFKIFQGASYHGAFSGFELPPLPVGLVWDTTRIAVDGTLGVRKE